MFYSKGCDEQQIKNYCHDIPQSHQGQQLQALYESIGRIQIYEDTSGNQCNVRTNEVKNIPNVSEEQLAVGYAMQELFSQEAAQDHNIHITQAVCPIVSLYLVLWV
mmetsp:Transcript_34568/g.60727  ORF Transcript_34568/g.60727 Transcript_34568/m.60727 type:complete len:106 (-) Transcript_34568:809-1126(-)